MNSQKGMATLLVTSMLLVVSLLFSLASYKNTFYQIKRTQNEVLARQAHWLAEGGLECGFALVNDLKDVDLTRAQLASKCKVPLNLSSVNITGSGPYLLSAESKIDLAIKNLAKKFDMNKGSSGAMKSTADIYINGSSAFSTPDPGENNGGWECVAIRYKNIFSSRAGATNQGVIHGTPPSSDFVHNGDDCKVSHKTNVSSDNGYGNDFIKDTSVDPFYDTFNQTRDKWQEVKTDWNFVEIPSSKIIEAPVGHQFGIVEDCGAKIADQIELHKQRIWVSGSCEITASKKDADGNYQIVDGQPVKGGIDRIKEAFVSTSNKPILLLVHDGVFSIQASMNFPGLLYHLTTNFSPTNELWDEFEAKAYFGNYPLFPTLTKAKTAYFQRGSFTFAGGQILDAYGLAAYFDQSLNFAFNSDNIDEVTEGKNIRWVEGSWHDF